MVDLVDIGSPLRIKKTLLNTDNPLNGIVFLSQNASLGIILLDGGFITITTIGLSVQLLGSYFHNRD